MKRVSDPAVLLTTARGRPFQVSSVPNLPSHISVLYPTSFAILDLNMAADVGLRSQSIKSVDLSSLLSPAVNTQSEEAQKHKVFSKVPKCSAFFDSASDVVIAMLSFPSLLQSFVFISFSISSSQFSQPSVIPAESVKAAHMHCFLSTQSMFVTLTRSSVEVYEFSFSAQDGSPLFQKRHEHAISAVDWDSGRTGNGPEMVASDSAVYILFGNVILAYLAQFGGVRRIMNAVSKSISDPRPVHGKGEDYLAIAVDPAGQSLVILRETSLYSFCPSGRGSVGFRHIATISGIAGILHPKEDVNIFSLQMWVLSKNCIALEVDNSVLHVLDLLNSKIVLSLVLPAESQVPSLPAAMGPSSTSSLASATYGLTRNASSSSVKNNNTSGPSVHFEKPTSQLNVSGSRVFILDATPLTDRRLIVSSPYGLLELPLSSIHLENAVSDSEKWFRMYGTPGNDGAKEKLSVFATPQNPALEFAFANTPVAIDTANKHVKDWVAVPQRRFYTPLNFAVFPVLKDAVTKQSAQFDVTVDDQQRLQNRSDAAFANNSLHDLRALLESTVVRSAWTPETANPSWRQPFSCMLSPHSEENVCSGRLIWSWSLLERVWSRHSPPKAAPWTDFSSVSSAADLVRETKRLISCGPEHSFSMISESPSMESLFSKALAMLWCGYIPVARMLLCPQFASEWAEIVEMNSDAVANVDLFSVDPDVSLNQDSLLDYLQMYISKREAGDLSESERDAMEARMVDIVGKWKGL
eukprot:ANDGO_03179.mRNA.1 hypothetical protein